EQREGRREGAAARAHERDLVHHEAREVDLGLAVVSALEHDRPARAHGAARELEAVGMARAFHDQVGRTRLEGRQRRGGHPARGEERERPRGAAPGPAPPRGGGAPAGGGRPPARPSRHPVTASVWATRWPSLPAPITTTL